MRNQLLSMALLCAVSGAANADVVKTEANGGNLVMEDVPPIPAEIAASLNQYQNVRSASFVDWQEDSQGIFVSTRFSDVSQLHRVDMPGGARHQLTYATEPTGNALRRPGSSQMIFSRDAGGSEFSQLFTLDPDSGQSVMVTDGESRNGAPVWDREGRRLAWQSTRRNGASNDIWIMDPDVPEDARVVLESPDGSWWGPVEFSSSGTQVLALNYVSISDSRAHLVDLDSGSYTLLAGGDDSATTNYPVAFDDGGDGYWLITSQGSDFQNLAWQALAPDAAPEIITNDIEWDVTGAAISDDRQRMAFAVNENGMTRVYLLDPSTREYRAIENVPVGLAFSLQFSPDNSRLAMTLNNSGTPSDTFVLALGDDPLEYGELVRWTTSEVGGLNTTSFLAPELIEYPTFDEVDGQPRQIPAWVYKPAGPGPFPVVVSIHGGPEGQSRPTFSSTYQMWLKNLGVAVVVPNVRGSNGYGKEYLSLDNGFLREDSVKDIGALLDWIDAQPDLDGDRVAVFGGSYGGYMVLASAVHFSDRLRAAVDIVGISSFVTFLENTQDYRRDLRRVEYGDERDPAMRAHLEKISPVNNVDKITIPIFVVQGENDPRVPVTESEQMVEALRANGNTVWYMNALNEGHGYRKKENRDLYQQATVLFLQQHLIEAD
ncbi:MAG: prolyl oligopeptidase family serine peptidase [Pseudomonadota bacterium]